MKLYKIDDKNHELLNNIDHQRATVLFFHPSCIHCMMMRNAWNEMLSKLSQSRKPCNVYEVNGEHMHNMNHDVVQYAQGFPTIVNLNNGKMLNSFNKERTVDNMLSYVMSNSANNKTKKNVRFMDDIDNSMVHQKKQYLNKKKSNKAKPTAKKTAKRNKKSQGTQKRQKRQKRQNMKKGKNSKNIKTQKNMKSKK